MSKRKFPIANYICYLLVLAVCITSVTFSRYLSSGAGISSAPLSRFSSSYQIADISSFAYNNSDYWWTEDGNKNQHATSSARTIRFTVNNFENVGTGESATTLGPSDVDLQATIRFTAPLEFVSRLALQVEQFTTSGSVIVSPQYVLRDLIYNVKEETVTGSDGISHQEYQLPVDDKNKPIKTYASHNSQSGTKIETIKSRDYGAKYNETRTGTTEQASNSTILYGTAIHETLTVTGGFNGDENTANGSITAQSERGSKITLTSSVKTAEYSIGFNRGEIIIPESTLQNNQLALINGSASPLYVMFQENMPYCTVDIALPCMVLTGGQKSTLGFVLYATLTERIPLLDDKLLEPIDSNANDPQTETSLSQDDWQKILLENPTSDLTSKITLGNAIVTGYHYTVSDLPIYQQGSGDEQKGITKIQIRQTYDYVNKENKLTLLHVSPLSDNSVEQAHPIDEFYRNPGSVTPLGNKVDAPIDIIRARSLLAKCEKKLSSTGEKITEYVVLSKLPSSPRFKNQEDNPPAGDQYSFGQPLSKAIDVKFSVLFVQASQSRSN